MQEQLTTTWNTVRRSSTQTAGKLSRLILAFPFISFLGLMAVLVALIVVGNQLRQSKTEKTAEAPDPKVVQVYQLGGSPEITVQAKIEKSGVIKLIAQTPGVVQKIAATEGDHVNRGTQLFSLSTNYQGANAASLSRKMSQRNFAFILDTYQTQLDAIHIQRDIATKTETQLADLRDIARKSIDETKAHITLNEDIIAMLDKQIKDAEIANPNDPQIPGLKMQKSQMLGALNGLKAGLRNTEYLNNESEEPAELARLVRDATLKQLEVQAQALDLSRDMAYFNVKLEKIAESLMYPASPCPGTVERIHVRIGEAVSPGTLLATIKGDDNTATAVALVPGDLVPMVSNYEASTFFISGQTWQVVPRYVAEEPTDGNLHAVLYSLPEEVAPVLPNGTFVSVKMPIGSGMYKGGMTFIPLDAVYHSQDGAYVLVMDTSTQPAKAVSKKVVLSDVFGQFVAVNSGLETNEPVILNRSILEGDVVTTTPDSR